MKSGERCLDETRMCDILVGVDFYASYIPLKVIIALLLGTNSGC